MYYYYTSMTNCTVSWADGPAPFDMLGLNPVVKNNAFLWSGYGGGGKSRRQRELEGACVHA